MEQTQICSSPVYDRLPPLSADFPWLVAQTFKEADVTGDQIFYTIHDPKSHFRCQIPELVGRHIRGCFYGWVILSNHPHGDKWSLWNPIASKFIFLPRLIMKDGDSDYILECCLSSPPGDPGSIILLTRNTKPNFVFCRLDRKRKRSRWTEMSYSNQLSSITGVQNGFLLELTCCNGKVYALTSDWVIHIQIVVNDKEVVISLCPFVSYPSYDGAGRCFNEFLKASSQELFAIIIDFTYSTKKTPVDMCLYKLDMTSMVWTEMNELKGTVFFVDLIDWDVSVTCSPAIASELGGYIHILHETSKVIYSYDVKDKSISMSSIRCLDLSPRSRPGVLPTSHMSVWTMLEFRLQGDHGEAKCKSDSKQDEGKEDEMMVVRSCRNDEVESCSNTNEPQLLDIPFHVLEKIMEYCIGVEYLNFRATCKRCHLAAPVIRWSNKKAQRRLQTYSLNSPWLMAFEMDQGIITFTDSMFGDEYRMKGSQELFFEKRILCSRYGWLLLFIGLRRIVFFNPFTSDIRELPDAPHLECFCFSAPPTSPDCVVVGFATTLFDETTVYLHSVAREPSWRIIFLDLGGADSLSFRFPTFCGRDVYTLSNEGALQLFKDNNLSLETVVAEAPRSCCGISTEYFLVKCDQHLLLVVVGDFGESIEVFKLKDSTKEWEKIDGLGRHMIYLCGATCLCMDAKTPEMENKIYFSLLHSKNEKIVFYSLDTCKYHTFDGRDVDEILRGVFETKHKFFADAWIEPSWA